MTNTLKIILKKIGLFWLLLHKGFLSNRPLIISCILLTLALYGIVLFRNNFLFIYQSNKVVIQMLMAIICVFISVLFYLIWLKKIEIHLSVDSFLATTALLITILFFLLQGTLETVQTKRNISATNAYNCSLAKDLYKTLTDSPDSISSNSHPFLIDIYRNNLQFIYENFPLKVSNSIFQTIEQMEEANSLTFLIGQLSVTPIPADVGKQAVISKNNQIRFFASSTADVLCSF